MKIAMKADIFQTAQMLPSLVPFWGAVQGDCQLKNGHLGLYWYLWHALSCKNWDILFISIGDLWLYSSDILITSIILGHSDS